LRKGLGAAAMLAVLALLGPAWGQTAKLAIGYVPNADFVPLFVAQDKGYFTKAGLEVSLTPIPIPSNVPPALTSGSIDLGPVTVPVLVATTENGLDLVGVAGMTRNLAANPLTSLMVRTGMAYSGPTDLKGKHVGMPGLLGSFDLHFRLWLKLHGVAADQVNEVDVAFPPMSDMLKTGQLDAAVVIEPFRTQVLKSGSGVRAADFIGEVSKDDLGLLWAAKKDWAAAHMKERAAFLAGLKEGIADVLQDRKGAEATEAKYLKFTAPVTGDFSFGLTAEDIKWYEDGMLEVGFLKQRIDPAKLIAQ
jgi:NitT/TauT family transport system substrate-binding protein